MSSPDHTLTALFGSRSVPLGTHSHPCSYLPGLTATDEAWLSAGLSPAAYHELMNRGFRRSGHILYRPVCDGCRKCIPIRVPVAEFAPSKSQRRVLQRNLDVALAATPPRLTAEKHEVYQRYLAAQHQQSPQGSDAESLREFLYSSCVHTIEFEYRDARGMLLGVSIGDISKQSLSSVYHYFDPLHHKRSIGVLSVLREIAWARAHGLAHYYLGYWIQGCATMDYKARYQPHELLVQGQWVRGNQDQPQAAPDGATGH